MEFGYREVAVGCFLFFSSRNGARCWILEPVTTAHLILYVENTWFSSTELNLHCKRSLRLKGKCVIWLSYLKRKRELILKGGEKKLQIQFSRSKWTLQHHLYRHNRWSLFVFSLSCLVDACWTHCGEGWTFVQRHMTLQIYLACCIFDCSLRMLIFIFADGLGARTGMQWFGFWPLVLYQWGFSWREWL